MTGDEQTNGRQYFAMIQWVTRNRTTVYLVLNIGLALAVLGAAVLENAPIGRAIYASALFALCSAPLLFLKSLNNRYVLLAFFMAPYFLYFGALDVVSLLFGENAPPIRNAFLTTAEFAILSGGALVLCGYLCGAKMGSRAGKEGPAAEWPAGTTLILGAGVWLVGTAAIVYFQVFVVPEKSGTSARLGLVSMGPLLTFIVMLGNLAQPLGLLMLAYGYAKYRSLLWQLLILAVVAAQAVVGFIVDIKSIAMIAGVAIIMTRILVNNRLPVAWIVGSVAFVIVAFPVFQAYRAEVAGERGLNRAQALAQLGKVIEIAFASRDKVTHGQAGERSQTFVERASSKGNLDILFEHVGTDVPFLDGASLVALPMAFVPRLIAPDKEDVAVGQLFNMQILKNQNDTYISISHLGELYWNFGWPGIFLAMPLIGMLLGLVGAKTSLEQGTSLTRVLVLVGTAQTLCLGFGGGLPVSYIVWLRSLAAIGLLHLLFARRTGQSAPQVGATAMAETASVRTSLQAGFGAASPPFAARFPNMLR
jgi:hypothetical protein